MELVQAKYAAVGSDPGGDLRQRVRQILLFPQAGVYFLHEAVEVGAACRHLQAGEEQVHQEGLATSHAAPQVNALDRFASRHPAETGEQPLCQPGLTTAGAVKRTAQSLEAIDSSLLCGIGGIAMTRELAVVGGREPWRSGFSATGQERSSVRSRNCSRACGLASASVFLTGRP
jgi:hypothetical protein